MAIAFSPGNITLFFGIAPHKDPMKMGSIGVSFAVSKGAWAAARKSQKTSIRVNGIKKHFPTVEAALSLLSDRHVEISITAELPLGCGYGMSGACTLASLLAANKELGLKKSRGELALIAHKAEVLNKTGLGSVTAEYLGGFLVREKKGNPLAAERIPIQKRNLYHSSFGPMSTKEILSDPKMVKIINLSCRVAFRRLNALEKPYSLGHVLRIGKEFARSTGLLKGSRMISTISSIESRGGFAAVNMLGRSIIATIPFPHASVLQISRQGARLIHK